MNKKQINDLGAMLFLPIVVIILAASLSNNLFLEIIGMTLIIFWIPIRIISWWKYRKELYTNYKLVKEKLKKEK